ncbi:hypothetical protein GCM10011611_44850 [Aliidongia dinghuensis]|uniref:Uncharacterized protein n=1 Tax=Aliidongia dinghuensis TaxID=1867774 RepID=A0A8J3E3V4_9PROT|nr:hypothetical protein GCM10011611_44850 [Aliidongia dinghuensis]
MGVSGPHTEDARKFRLCRDVFNAPFEKNSNTKVTTITSPTPYGVGMATMKQTAAQAAFRRSPG